jgi:hypothetical protein
MGDFYFRLRANVGWSPRKLPDRTSLQQARRAALALDTKRRASSHRDPCHISLDSGAFPGNFVS